MPDSPRHDVRLAGPKENLRLVANRLLITVVENQFHRPAHDIQELVSVWVHLTTVRSGSIDVLNRADGVSIDTPWGPRRGRCDAHGPVATDVRNASIEGNGRPVRVRRHVRTSSTGTTVRLSTRPEMAQKEGLVRIPLEEGYLHMAARVDVQGFLSRTECVE